MRKYIYLLAIALCSALTLGSCSDDDDNVSVPEAVQTAFTAKYPNANRVGWEIKSGFYVAEFHENATETEVWFSKEGTWNMTETDYGRNISLIPATVKSAFESSEYSTWSIDDVSKYEREDITFYLIEIESRGQKDRHLFYGEDGTLIKDIAESGNDDIFPFTPVP
ncbi:MAG: PepSY-like domain-containing protein [Bacteroides sp.]|nr:PepSY-like domain-containing protein [Roseburia sp.]MCM1346194.1 PepSY-like domain-containing protein [Bacteroides sp.]MCM1420669.1 PepSY-like domain-containing protein [Bacteroides sp.]